MITADYYIDQVQNSKKLMIKMLVTNEVAAKTMNEFIDHQTEYTKNFVSSANKMVSELTTEFIKNSQEVAKFDYSKFADTISKSFHSFPIKKG